MDRQQAEHFYEDDEPIEDVLAAFAAGEKGVTAPSSPGVRFKPGAPEGTIRIQYAFRLEPGVAVNEHPSVRVT